jgi:flagellin-like hook-associated protein FlgL
LFDTSVSIANTKSGSTYIFAGDQSNVQPINTMTGELTGSSNSVSVNVSQGINIGTNISAGSLFSFKRVNAADSVTAILPTYNWTNDGANTIPDADPLSALETAAPASLTYAINPQDSISIDGTSVTLNSGTAPVNYDANGFAAQLQSAIQAQGGVNPALANVTVSYDPTGHKFTIAGAAGAGDSVNWGSTTPDIEQELGFVQSGNQSIDPSIQTAESDYTVGAFNSSNSIFTANGGTINIKSGSGPAGGVGVTIAANSTLQDVRDAINSANAGVKAQVVNKGTTTNPDFRLVVASEPAGSSANIDISVSSTTDPSGKGINMLSYDKTTGNNMTLENNITNYNYITQATANDSIVIDDGTNGGVANNQIVVTVNGNQATATIARGTYTHDQLATAVTTALNNAANAASGVSGQDSYNVTYDTNANKFSIAPNAGNLDTLTLNWSNSSSTARQLLGFNTTDESAGLTIGAGNDTIVYNANAGAAGDNMTATINPGTYTTGADLAAAIQTALNSAVGGGTAISDFVVNYDTSTNKFNISTPTGSLDSQVTINWNSGLLSAAQLGFSGASTTVNAGGGAGTATSGTSVSLNDTSDNSVLANYYSFNNNYLNDNNILRALNFLKVSLQNNDSGRVQQAIQYTGDLSSTVSEKLADVGSRENEITEIGNYQSGQTTNVTSAMSNAQDADIAKISSDLAQQQATLQALLTMSASVLQQNLFQYLK